MRLWGLSLAVVTVGACADRGSITFQVNQPDVAVFNPVTSRLSEYELKTAKGEVVAVATVNSTSREAVLPLGALPLTAAPVDMVMSLFSGAELQGMARIRGVSVVKEQQTTYEANVRKPLVFVGATLPSEAQVGNAIGDGKILDFTNGTNDLQHPTVPGPSTPPIMPEATAAAAVVADGTLLVAGRPNLLTSYDTGNAMSKGVSLPFTPVKVVAAPLDTAVVALDAGDASGGRLALFRSLAELRGDAMPTMLTLPGVNPRTAVFASDAIYVLGGGSTDPCQPGKPAPAANSITVVTPAGEISKTWAMPDFVSDIAAGPNGVVYLSRATANQVAKLVPAGDMPMTTKLFDATCPTALRVTRGGDILVVTDTPHPNFVNAFSMLRGRDDNNKPSQIPLGLPAYQVPTEDMAPPPGAPSPSLTVFPKSLFAYDMAVTTDGLRAVFASRIAYRQAGDHFTLLGLDCVANLEIIEYGLNVVDTISGSATYEPRSLAVTQPARETDPCVQCDLGFGLGTYPFYCPSGPGDRIGGLAAMFDGPWGAP
jgi:hypothetical protein